MVLTMEGSRDVQKNYQGIFKISYVASLCIEMCYSLKYGKIKSQNVFKNKVRQIDFKYILTFEVHAPPYFCDF